MSCAPRSLIVNQNTRWAQATVSRAIAGLQRAAVTDRAMTLSRIKTDQAWVGGERVDGGRGGRADTSGRAGRGRGRGEGAGRAQGGASR